MQQCEGGGLRAHIDVGRQLQHCVVDVLNAGQQGQQAGAGGSVAGADQPELRSHRGYLVVPQVGR